MRYVYILQVPLASGEWYELCRCDSALAVGSIIETLLADGVIGPGRIMIVVVPAQ